MRCDAAKLRGVHVILSMNRPGFRKRGWSLPALFAACKVSQSVTVTSCSGRQLLANANAAPGCKMVQPCFAVKTVTAFWEQACKQGTPSHVQLSEGSRRPILTWHKSCSLCASKYKRAFRKRGVPDLGMSVCII